MKIKKRKRGYLFGFYVLDPYTMRKDTDIKGVPTKDAFKVFKEFYGKYR